MAPAISIVLTGSRQTRLHATAIALEHVDKIKPRHFGISHPPICESSRRSAMRITRREPHPLYGFEYELQSFECPTLPASVRTIRPC
jgi:hypothetical protein